MLIRPLDRTDTAETNAMLAVIHAAFTTPESPDTEPVEVELTRRLLAGPDAVDALTLVALSRDTHEIVGMVMGTQSWIGDERAVGLGPLAVAPDAQSHGIGSALVHAVVAASDALRYPVAALLGEPAYYSRFGFVAAETLDVRSPDPQWGTYFQARRLSSWTDSAVGDFRYAPPFTEM
ncbi:GNAT family N-acetyltransferase [Williamsia maris]|uniref:Acetyltransferase n=1 Tax=Williamsia maris TaxID=72806 RepID=A0ABT1HGS0_9NOCA|nr:N-acetyltransferase [Williamsia maris]MCP2177384.1 putative acetyltransferase [Williamsia maris]